MNAQQSAHNDAFYNEFSFVIVAERRQIYMNRYRFSLSAQLFTWVHSLKRNFFSFSLTISFCTSTTNIEYLLCVDSSIQSIPYLQQLQTNKTLRALIKPLQIICV